MPAWVGVRVGWGWQTRQPEAAQRRRLQSPRPLPAQPGHAQSHASLGWSPCGSGAADTPA
eukprot:6324596-Amphidinium_carterae.1